MKIRIPTYSTITGSPEAILQVMQDARFFDRPTGDDYIKTIMQDSWQFYGIGLHVTGETHAERAESLLREMAKANMITIEEE
jgi:hypothetical protein